MQPPMQRQCSLSFQGKSTHQASHRTAAVRCFERYFEGREKRPPVKLVVFDFDETLTLLTLMPNAKHLTTQIGANGANFRLTVKQDDLVSWNFESPFTDGCRVEKLKECLSKLRSGGNGEQRTLSILTKNEGGAIACLNLLIMAGLDKYFSAIWSMEAKDSNACYKDGETWDTFTCPRGRSLSTIYSHKADILYDVTQNPQDWFPQLDGDSQDLQGLLELRPEHIVLVDDVRSNFQSTSPMKAKLLRCCKVARHDGMHLNKFQFNMGGLGARSLNDYETLEEFVNAPWKFRDELGVRCSELPFDGDNLHPPVKLVMFGYGETLSISTFMPEGDRFSKRSQEAIRTFKNNIGCTDIGPEDMKQLIKYNFESPYVEGNRIDKLKAMLSSIVGGEGQRRSLAVLTKNSYGAVALLNMLMLADLAEHFCAIWTLEAGPDVPNGVYKDAEGWKTFALPVTGSAGDESHKGYKATVLQEVQQNPGAWFPQLKASGVEWAHLQELNLYNCVLVDDENESFRRTKASLEQEGSCQTSKVPRYIKVAHFEDEYRDLGFCVHLGGIGAKSDKDYELLRDFVEAPWNSRRLDVGRDSSIRSADSYTYPDEIQRRVSKDHESNLDNSLRSEARVSQISDRKMLVLSGSYIDLESVVVEQPGKQCGNCSACSRASCNLQ